MDWCRRGSVNVLRVGGAFRSALGGGHLAGLRPAGESGFPGVD